MRKTTKRDNINLLISAFLVIGYIVCAYFFSSFVGTTVDAAVGGIINMAIYLVFGLILFYATRVVTANSSFASASPRSSSSTCLQFILSRRILRSAFRSIRSWRPILPSQCSRQRRSVTEFRTPS